MQLNSNEIEKILPHRYPFLLVDRITDYQPGQWAKGYKCVSANEQQFCGHFPGRHVMPGVKNARFRAKVEPGDILELECELINRRGPLGIGKGVAKVNGKVAAAAELSFAIGE